jgi:hypothetical protein
VQRTRLFSSLRSATFAIILAAEIRESMSQANADAHDGQQPLSRSELHQLTLFKWRYSLEALGFAPYQVDQLMFLTWLRATQRVPG